MNSPSKSAESRVQSCRDFSDIHPAAPVQNSSQCLQIGCLHEKLANSVTPCQLDKLGQSVDVVVSDYILNI